uniref:Mono-ADP ribosylhydrolase 2 n=1 Tax=Crocodylus porosus TaxID=8502 RepID=A0A7M4F163_CROPO
MVEQESQRDLKGHNLDLKETLLSNQDNKKVDRIIFCVFLEVDYKIFKKKMGEFFPIEGLEQEGQPPSPTKCKSKQVEDLQDDKEDDNGTEEKQSTEETEGRSQEADETMPSDVPSQPSEEEIEMHVDKESSKDFKATQENDPAHREMCEQDEAEEQQDDSSKDEMKTDADSQSSCMELEESLLIQEDAVKVEKPVIPVIDEDKEGNKKEKTGATPGKGKPSAEPVKAENPCDTEDISSNDAEMNSQVESINESTESQPED